jgi:hypothetical protein
MDVSRDCNFISKDNLCVCSKCGFSIKGECGKIHKKCDSSPKELSYPSLIKMAANMVNSTIDFIADGGKLVDEEEQSRRLGICQGNEEAGIPACPEYDAKQNRCYQCGCHLGLASAIASKHCPLQRW